ncbi:LysR family transcriptional regulator [Labrys monachus]|uniref:DNA-binding transcriptional LysR family regulator n=1 Tax=Labrys monachus TaxID=217067 RepID=A0ABU0FA89_9HYPH|nr:LysR substrate-binding domain-containing protein [Labrys monachus]MDQ0391541.1 DNA-binding transcriptional LysR family regulator [Labrys monachus]
MDLGWLEDYLVLRELGSFTAAAERRNLSQPAFSRRIQALEAWLGVTLVDRSCRPHRFTPVALENDLDLHRFLNQIYDLRSQLRGEQARASRLRVAVQHSLSISLFPRLVESLRHNGFQPAYHLYCGDRSQCIDMMLRNEVDLLICHETDRTPAQIPSATAVRLIAGQDAMILVGLPDSAAFAAGAPAEGRKLALLTYPQSSFFGSVIWEQAMPRLTGRFEVETMCISAFSSALRAMVLAGLGMAWLPRSLVGADIRSGVLAAFDPDGLQHPLDIAIYAHRPRGSDQDVALWQHLAQIDLAALMH